MMMAISSPMSPMTRMPHTPQKRGQKHHGYKIHIATDTNSIIKEVVTTTAKVHDSTQFEKLTEDESKAVFADSGYMSKERKRSLRERGIFCGIVERRVRGQKELRAKQSRNNQRFAKVRALVEMPFAFIKRLMNYTETRYLGLHKNSQHHYLLAAAYNLRRIPKLLEALSQNEKYPKRLVQIAAQRDKKSRNSKKITLKRKIVADKM